jgi:hypothetical protein
MNRTLHAVATAAALSLLAGSALAQNALGGGRALDNGLSAQPGGRVNLSASDYQSIVRFNTNAGNALNGPGLDVNTLNARGSLVAPWNRSNVGLSNSASSSRLNSTLGSPLGSSSGSMIDRVAVLEAGYLPQGALTSSVTLPQGTSSDDYRRTVEPYVGYVFDNRGNPILARGSTLRGLTLAPYVPIQPVSAPADAAKIGSAATYNRVIDELRRASLASGVDNPNRVDTSATPPSVTANTPPAQPPSTNPDTTKPAKAPENADKSSPSTNPADSNPASNPSTAPGSTKYDTDAALKRLRERLAPPPAPGDARTKPAVTTADPSKAAATSALTDEDVKALREMNIKLETLVPAGATDAQATDAYTRLGQEALSSGHFGLADQMFQSALSRNQGNTLALAGRINSVMGLGLLMTGGSDLRNFYVDHPEMIPVRFEASLLMPRSRADSLADMLTADIGRGDASLLNNSGLTLAYLGRQFDNNAWLTKGLDTMTLQTKDDPQGTQLVAILRKVWNVPASAGSAPAPAKPAAEPGK